MKEQQSSIDLVTELRKRRRKPKASPAPSGSRAIPLKELRSVIPRVLADAQYNVAYYDRYHDYERGDVAREKKWRARLKELQTINAWLTSLPENVQAVATASTGARSHD